MKNALMGRNWMELGLLMPGVSTTQTSPRGVGSGRGDPHNQSVIIDGADSREECCTRSGGTHSQEAIGEFKIMSNNFSAEYGRSSAYVLTAVTKSGTNALRGSAFYLLRNENLDKPDFFTKIAEPLRYYQTGGSIGGPIRKDRAFFFGALERQYDERTGFSNTGFKELDSWKVPLRAWQNYALGKVDLQFRGTQHLMGKYYYWHQDDLNGSVASTRGVVGRETPSSTTDRTMTNHGAVINHTWADGADGKKGNAFTFGFFWVDWRWVGKSGIPVRDGGFRNLEFDMPRIVAPSFNLGYNTATPQDPAWEYKFEFKNNFSYFFDFKGTHNVKLGGSIIVGNFEMGYFRNARGEIRFAADPIDPFDFNSYPEPTRFQLAQSRDTAACPEKITADLRTAFERTGGCGLYTWNPFHFFSGFVQDDWRVNPRLSLDLGVRYDLEDGWLDQDYLERVRSQLNPQIPTAVGNDRNNVAPRVGLIYNLREGGTTVIRGGAGIYFGSATYSIRLQKFTADGWNNIVADQAFPTRQLCFQGHTLEEAITQNPKLLLPGCGALSVDELKTGAIAISAIEPNFQIDRAVHLTIGLAHELTDDMGIEVDVVSNHTAPGRSASDTNLFLDPATGGPKDPRVFGRPDPRFSSINTASSWGRSVFKALEVRVNKRLRQNYQFQANYTLASTRDNVEGGWILPTTDNPFDRNEWAPSSGSQRHRLAVNGMLELPLGLELSGVFVAWSGQHYDNVVAGDFWGLGRSTSRVYRDADGAIVRLQRNSNVGKALAKLDLRVAKWFNLGGERQLGLIVEVFNVLNRTNFGTYGTVLGSRTYQQPLRNPSNLVSPRQTQVGMRFTF